MISDLPFFMKENNIEIAILTLPKNKARDMAEILIENGIKSYLEFCTYRSESAKRCDRRKRTSFRQSDEAVI